MTIPMCPPRSGRCCHRLPRRPVRRVRPRGGSFQPRGTGPAPGRIPVRKPIPGARQRAWNGRSTTSGARMRTTSTRTRIATQEVQNAMVTGASRVINRPGSGGVNNPRSFAYLQLGHVIRSTTRPMPRCRQHSGHIVCRATISSGSGAARRGGRLRAVQSVRNREYKPGLARLRLRTLTEDIGISQHVVCGQRAGTAGRAVGRTAGDGSRR